MSETATETTTETETPAVETDPVETPETDDSDPRVKRANQQAANYRTQLRATEGKVTELETALAQQGATLQQLAAVFNPEAPAGDDPAEALTTITREAESLRTENATLKAELTVHTLAADNGGNPNALLDSRSFLNSLQALDASADDYRTQVADAIKAAVEANANLSATGPAPAKGGAPGAGQGSAAAGGVTQEQFNAMGLGERNDLFRRDPDTYRRLADAI